jgi:hypothetical protein
LSKQKTYDAIETLQKNLNKFTVIAQKREVGFIYKPHHTMLSHYHISEPLKLATGKLPFLSIH